MQPDSPTEFKGKQGMDRGAFLGWEPRMRTALDQFFVASDKTRDGFVDVLWKYGILDRIAPNNQEEITARIEGSRPVFENSRDDPQLYWRILYSAQAARQAIENGWSIVVNSNSYVIGAISGINQGIRNGTLAKLYSMPADDTVDPLIPAIDDIVNRAKRELESRGQETTGHPLSPGAKGKWHDISVTVDRFTGQGGIWFEAQTYKDHTMLVGATIENRGAVMPWEVDTRNFQ